MLPQGERVLSEYFAENWLKVVQLPPQFRYTNEELLKVVIGAVYHSDNQCIVTHDVILEFHGSTYIFYESFAALLGFGADSTRAIVYLTDV